MCLLFVTVDLGHPDRFHHMIPPFGIFNFPGSMLSWDVIVLNGYLLLNLHIAGYLLYCRYRQRKPTKLFYIPFVFLSIAVGGEHPHRHRFPLRRPGRAAVTGTTRWCPRGSSPPPSWPARR